MTDQVRYSDDLFYWEYLIATEDGLEIEAHLWRVLESSDQRGQEKWVAARKHALRAIDQLKIEGQYERERARLTDLRPVASISLDADYLERRRNFDFGCASHDLDQRARFRAFRDLTGFHDRPWKEQAVLLGIQTEKAKGFLTPANRPKAIPPRREAVKKLDYMRLRLKGSTEQNAVQEAAREYSNLKVPENVKLSESEQKKVGRLIAHYHARLELRR